MTARPCSWTSSGPDADPTLEQGDGGAGGSPVLGPPRNGRLQYLAAAQAGVPVAEYSPSEVKYAVAGYGKAEKRQMQEMVRIILNLPHAPQPDDAADALAIALCHAQTAPFLNRVGGQERT